MTMNDLPRTPQMSRPQNAQLSVLSQANSSQPFDFHFLLKFAGASGSHGPLRMHTNLTLFWGVSSTDDLSISGIHKPPSPQTSPIEGLSWTISPESGVSWDLTGASKC